MHGSPNTYNTYKIFLYLADSSTTVKLKDYTSYLKSVYKTKTQVCSSDDDDHWPPPVTNKVFRLAMIMAEEVRRRNIEDDFIRNTITGRIDDILKKKVPIELTDIFEKIREGQQKKVLIEGAPGCGKSTLSLHICHQWMEGKLFQEYRLVILVTLREQAVQDAKRIADLLPRRDEAMAHEVEEELTSCDGKGVLFVFDGWDELPQNVQRCSIIKDILNNTNLHNSSVIITSRPISSMSLHKVVNFRIEILGFTKDELQQYFAGCLENDTKNVDLLQQRIQENPTVAASCYLPLNASILVHLFKCDGNMLPKTQFGIFSALICNCIFRHLRKSTHHEISEVKSLDKLPQVVKEPFKRICAIAYNGVMEDKITFDLDRGFNTLGLLQGVESFAVSGMSHSYNFLHLSIQELLAAIHMATQLEDSQQIEQFRKLFGQARFSAVFQFYAAKTKMQTPGIDEIVIEAVKKCLQDKRAKQLTYDADPNSGASDFGHKPQPLLLSLLNCLFEAQDSSLCQLVVKELNLQLNLNGISLNPADCLSVGYFLTHCEGFEVNLSFCSIGDDECKTLFRQGEVYNLWNLK